MRRTAAFILAAFTVASFACFGNKGSPEGVSNAFVDRYYIERDHEGAQALAEGKAKERLSAELKLLGPKQPGGESYAPKVYYKRTSQQPVDGGTEFRYALTVDARPTQLHKDVRVRVSKVGEQNRVVSFSEQDAPPP